MDYRDFSPNNYNWVKLQEWDTDHVRHLVKYNSIIMPFYTEYEDFVSSEDDILFEDILEIENSNLKESTKGKLKSALYSIHFYSLEQKRKAKVGRPSNDHIHEFIIYLTDELGSNRQACKYALTAPYVDFDDKLESLIRSNRAYRNRG